MKCNEFTARLAEYVAGDMPRETRTQCDTHCTHCLDCKAYAASYESTIRLARDAFRDDPILPRSAVDAVIERILTRTVRRDCVTA